jgi:hypothetical protein
MKKPTPKLTDRERSLAAPKRIHAELAETRAKGHVIVAGALAIDLFPTTTTKDTTTMRPARHAAEPTNTIKLPANKEKAKSDVCKALGLPEDAPLSHIIATVDALLAALELSPEVIEQEALKFGLSAREAKMLAQMKVEPRKYVEAKAKRSYEPARRRSPWV